MGADSSPKLSAYIETTILGHLTARLSRDLVTAGHQQVTQEWWDGHREEFDLYVSELVVQEAGAGDPGEAGRRLAVLEGIPQLELTEACRRLAGELLRARNPNALCGRCTARCRGRRARDAVLADVELCSHR